MTIKVTIGEIRSTIYVESFILVSKSAHKAFFLSYAALLLDFRVCAMLYNVVVLILLL